MLSTRTESKKETPLYSALKNIFPPPLIDLVNQYRIPTTASLLEGFNRSDSRVAFALDELTEEERMRVLAILPVPLKFYYYTKEEFQREIVKSEYQEFNQALYCELLRNDARHQTQLGYPGMPLVMEERYHLNFSKSKKDFEELCRHYPMPLIYILKIRYAYLNKTDHVFSLQGVVISMMQRYGAMHLNLPDYNARDILYKVDLRGANLRGAVIHQMHDLDLRYADLTEVKVNFVTNCDCRYANLTNVSFTFTTEKISWKNTDFLNAILDEKNKKAIQKNVPVSWLSLNTALQPIFNFFNNTFNKHTTLTFFNKKPSWDMCVHFMRVMKSSSYAEFTSYRQDIPKELITPAFRSALDQAADNFLRATGEVVEKHFI